MNVDRLFIRGNFPKIMIECIRTYRLPYKLDEPFDFLRWHYDVRNALLVEVVDRSGASGWGECEQMCWGFQDFLSKGGVTIAQPNLADCGGLKQSGVSKDCSRYSLEEYLTLKRVTVAID